MNADILTRRPCRVKECARPHFRRNQQATRLSLRPERQKTMNEKQPPWLMWCVVGMVVWTVIALTVLMAVSHSGAATG